MDTSVLGSDLGHPYQVVEQPPSRLPGMEQLVVRFGNGYGMSIVRGPYTYGGDAGLYEVAIAKFDGEGDNWELCYDTPITDDVLGWQSEYEVSGLAVQVAELPPHLAVR